MLCCYYTKILFTNAAISKRGKIQNRQQSGSHSVEPVALGNNLLFPVSMSKAIFKLNNSYDCTVSVDSIFTHPNLIGSVY